MDFWERLEVTVNQKANRKTVASEVGILANSFSNWKKRGTYPAADIIVRLAGALDTTVEYLVTGQEPAIALASSIANRPALRDLVEQLASLSNEDIIRANKILDAAIFDTKAEGPPFQAKETG